MVPLMTQQTFRKHIFLCFFGYKTIKTHVKKYCHKVYENSGVNLFWSIDNSLEVINAINSKRYTVSEINTFDFLTLYTSLPLHLVKT